LLSFDRKRGDNWDVWVMNADGSDQRQLTFSPVEDDYAEWAPNGRWLAFLSKRDGPRAVYVISIVTGGAWRVTDKGQFPDWTPDGRIIYTQPGVGTVFTIRPNGTQRQPLATQPGDVLGLRVSNDGQKIVYATHGFDIYTAGIDGTEATRLTASSEAEDDPVWSPDGQWITFDKGNHASGLEDVLRHARRRKRPGSTDLRSQRLLPRLGHKRTAMIPQAEKGQPGECRLHLNSWPTRARSYSPHAREGRWGG
jgi:Tol biopolymer transport system component